jgi:ABC-type uncharacterized transport system fused permease/ATPase subunit
MYIKTTRLTRTSLLIKATHMKLAYWFFAVSIALCICAFAIPQQKQHFVNVELALSIILVNIGAIMCYQSVSHRIEELLTEMYHDQENMHRHVDRLFDEAKSNSGKVSK